MKSNSAVLERNEAEQETTAPDNLEAESGAKPQGDGDGGEEAAQEPAADDKSE